MFIKIIGAAIVVFVCGKVGFDFADRLARRVQGIRDVITGLTTLQAEITFASRPLAEALVASGDGIFSHAGEALTQKSGTAEDAWNCAIDEKGNEAALSVDDIVILRDMGRTLGSNDMDNQIKNIELAIHKLETSEKDAIEASKKFGKMYRTAGLLIGALIAILLI